MARHSIAIADDPNYMVRRKATTDQLRAMFGYWRRFGGAIDADFDRFSENDLGVRHLPDGSVHVRVCGTEWLDGRGHLDITEHSHVPPMPEWETRRVDPKSYDPYVDLKRYTDERPVYVPPAPLAPPPLQSADVWEAAAPLWRAKDARRFMDALGPLICDYPANFISIHGSIVREGARLRCDAHNQRQNSHKVFLVPPSTPPEVAADEINEWVRENG